MVGVSRPAQRFLLSAVGVACLLGVEYMRASIQHRTLLVALVELAMCAVSLAAAGVYLKGYLARRRTRPPTGDDAPATAPPPVQSPARRVFEGIVSLATLMGLGYLSGRFSWGQWVAGPGALGYAGWRTWRMARSGRLTAAGAPFYFAALIGGAAILLLIGWVVGAVAKG